MKEVTRMKKKIIAGIIFILLITSSMLVQAATSLTSDVFLVSDLNKTISRIPPKVSITDFKNQFSQKAENIHIYTDEKKTKEVTEGYVATNMVFTYEGSKDIYHISVIGDLNSDGIANQIELNRIIKCVIGMKGYELEGLNKLSGDITGDGVIDQRDVSALIKYIVFGTLDVGDILKPVAPSIEVIKGESNTENYYLSDVTVKITENTSTGVENLKTMYQVSGAETVPETEVKSGTTLTFTKEGTYTITAYTYSKEGTKSSVTTVTFTINKTAPKAGDLIAKLNNESGKDYVQGSYTNQNVYIALKTPEKGLEVSYEVTGSNVVEKGRKEPIVLTKEGTSTVIITTKNEAGNVTTSKFIVNIDKRAPAKPTLKIEGEKLLKDSQWYTGDVTITITAGKDVGIAGAEQVSYVVSGDAQIAESTLKTGESMTLQNEGTYTVRTYTIDKAGNKSDAETVVIKIDKTNPTVGSLEMKLNNKEGNSYTNNSWTNQSVWMAISDNGKDNQSGVLKTTYSITGPKETKDTNKETTIEEQGTYTVTVTTMDNAGRTSNKTYTVKIDKQAPEKTQVQVVEGNKADPTNEWYISNVLLQVLPVGTEDGGSPIVRTTYKMSGPISRDEVDITKDERIELLEDGVYNIIAYSYDEAGNKSAGTVVTIKRDATAPETAELSVEAKTGTSFNLIAHGEDMISNVKKYYFYIDGQLYKTIENYSTNVEYLAEKQESKEHECFIVVEDYAGNKSTSKAIKAKPGRLDYDDIEYVEIDITSFDIERENMGVNSGANFIVSDTSSSNASKFIQVNSEIKGSNAKLYGKISIMRKDGHRTELFEYFPEDLEILISTYRYGSGTTWKHNSKVMFLNENICEENINEGSTVGRKIAIKNKSEADNVFMIEEEMLEGTESYIRTIIESIICSGRNINYKIESSIV